MTEALTVACYKLHAALTAMLEFGLELEVERTVYKGRTEMIVTTALTVIPSSTLQSLGAKGNIPSGYIVS